MRYSAMFEYLTVELTILEKITHFFGPRIITAGILQGSVLSPVLFNMYIAQICTTEENTIIIQYADDIYTSNKKFEMCIQTLNQSVHY